MKKLLVILLMLVYGVSATGATVHLHFCCGKLDDISLSLPDKKSCPTKKVFSKNCCENKPIDLKVKADQEPSVKWVEAVKSLKSTSLTLSYQPLTSQYLSRMNLFATGPPIFLSALPLYIQHRVFRI